MASKYLHLFGAELPEWASDAVHTDVEVRLGFADRLRVLLFGRFDMRVVAYTENRIGRTAGESMFVPPRRRFWRRKHMGYVMFEPEEPERAGASQEGETK